MKKQAKYWIVGKTRFVMGVGFMNFILKVTSYKKDPRWAVNQADAHLYTSERNASRVAKNYDGAIIQVYFSGKK